MLQYLRSLVFNTQMYVVMALMALVYTPITLVYRPMAFPAIRTYCRYVRWSAAWMVGLRSEVRGAIPQGECLIASKHQSFLDILLIVSEVPRPKFIMKAELRFVPIIGWYAKWIGCVPVQREKRGHAAPDAKLPYMVGSAILYTQLGQECIPAATNVGLFWPRMGVLRKPGLAVVEFLPAIPPGTPPRAFMKELESAIETASDRLMAEAGYRQPD